MRQQVTPYLLLKKDADVSTFARFTERKPNGNVVNLLAKLSVFALACSSFLIVHSEAQTSAPQPVNGADAPGIEYRNSLYGFCFALPAGWKGYSIVTTQWSGTPLDGGPALAGTELLIRHPAWTQQNPREDIPIMIFTAAEWPRLEKEGVAVSPAPIGPSELGHNHRYVFALPPRWDFYNLPGVEEIGKLLLSKSLKAPCSRPGGS